jgi:MipA family protein
LIILTVAIYLSRGASRSWLATLLACLAGMSALFPSTVCAQTLVEQQLEQAGLGQQRAASGNWNNFLGAGVGVGPTYQGAASDRVRPIPFFLIDYRDELYLGPSGLRWRVIDTEGFRAGPLIGLLGGRSDNLSPRLEGMGDIRTSVTAGVFATYSAGPFRLATTFQQAINHTENGWLGLVELDYRTVVVTRKVLLAVGPDVELASGQYNQTWFGVSGVQSIDSGLPVFTPGAGVKDYGAHANLTYVCTRHVLLRAFVSVKEIAGNLTDSPIVQRSTETFVGIGVAYHFQ